MASGCGSIVNVGHGWGGMYVSGLFAGETAAQVSHLAAVRVTVRPSRLPDFDSGWFPLASQQNSASYIWRRHVLGVVPTRVKVLARVPDGANRNFVFEAAGSAQCDRTKWQSRTGGLVMAYSAREFRIWAPTSNPYGVNGYSVFAGEGWGGNSQPQYSTHVDVRILAWTADPAPDFDSLYFSMTAGVQAYTEVFHGLGALPERVQVVVTPAYAGSNFGFLFEGAGMAQADGWSTSTFYGGAVFAYNENYVRVWVPSANPKSPDRGSSSGRAISTYNGWGYGANAAADQYAKVRIKCWRHEVGQDDYTDVDVVVNVVEQPPVTASVETALDENPRNRTVVARISASSPSNASFQFSIVSGNIGFALAVFPTNGSVYVLNSLMFNFEVRTVIAVAIRVTDGFMSSFAMLRVNIGNVNDRPILVPGQVVRVAENSPVNALVGKTLNATDEDTRWGDSITFTVGGGLAGIFKIGGCDGQIRVQQAVLNFEAKPTYTLLVTVSDNGNAYQWAPLSTSGNVTITLTNENDPHVIPDQTRVVAENSPADSAVGAPVRCDEEDACPPYCAPKLFSLLGGDDTGVLALHNRTGQLSVARAVVNFEEMQQYDLTVSAVDDMYSAVGYVTVRVVDRNDPPVFSGTASASAVIPENSAPDALVLTVSASDEDVNDTISFAIVAEYPPPHASRGSMGPEVPLSFYIHATSGELRVIAGAHLDFEVRPQIVVTVRVTDAGGNTRAEPPASATKNFTVRLENLEEAPECASAVMYVAETASIGDVVGQLEAYDDDVAALPSEARALRFGFAPGQSSSVFMIAPTDGTVSVLRSAFDYEAQREYNLGTEVVDGTGLNASCGLRVLVNTSRHIRVSGCAVNAWRWDDGPGLDAVTPYLPDALDPTSADGIFTFNFGAGVDDAPACRTLCELMEDSACTGYTYFDGAYPASLFKRRCIGRSDVANESAYEPAFRDLQYGGRRFKECAEYTLDENTVVGTVLGQLTYRGDEGEFLRVGVNGENYRDGLGTVTSFQATNVTIVQVVVRADALNFEAQALWQLMLIAEDSKGNVLRTPFRVRLLDVDEPPRIAASESHVRAVFQGSNASLAIPPAFNGFDEDGGDSTTFAIVANNTNDYFRIDAVNGMLYTAKALPTLASASLRMNLGISLTDNAGHVTLTWLAVTIVYNNRPPVFDPPVPRAVRENSPVGTVVPPRVSATDPDSLNVLQVSAQHVERARRCALAYARPLRLMDIRMRSCTAICIRVCARVPIRVRAVLLREGAASRRPAHVRCGDGRHYHRRGRRAELRGARESRD